MNRIFAPFFLSALVVISFWSCRDTQSTSAAQAVDFERTSNEVAIGLRVEPDGLNPIIATTAYARQVNELIFQYLLDIHPQKLELRPQLAKGRAEVAPITQGPLAGGLAYTFEIREEAVWNDGRPVTGHDFVFTIKACLHPRVQAPRVRPFVSIMKEIEVSEENPKLFTVYTAEEDIIGEESIAWSVPVLPAHIYDPDGKLADIPYADFVDADKIESLVQSTPALQEFAEAFNGPEYSRTVENISGSGPYELVSWEAGQQVMLKRKSDWWGDEVAELNAYPDTLTYVFLSSDESALAALRAEEIDVLATIGPEDFEDLQETPYTAERYQFLTPPLLQHFFFYLNTDQPLLEDKRVRRALAHLVDVDDIVETYFLGYGRRHAAPVFLESSYYNTDLTPIDFSVEKAKQLLEEAGWSDSDENGILDKEINGERRELSIPYLYNVKSSRSESIGLLIQESAIRAGVEIVMEPEEYIILNEKTKTGDYYMALNGKSFSPTFWNPRQMWHTDATGGGDNRTGFGNAETDALIDEILVTKDEAKRTEMYLELQRMIYDEQPMIFLFVPTGRLVIHKRFDVDVSPVPPGYNAKDLRLNL